MRRGPSWRDGVISVLVAPLRQCSRPVAFRLPKFPAFPTQPRRSGHETGPPRGRPAGPKPKRGGKHTLFWRQVVLCSRTHGWWPGKSGAVAWITGVLYQPSGMDSSLTDQGTNENTNGLIRQYFRKGTDSRAISHHEVRGVENLLNNRPRARLGFRTPAEVFFEKNPPAGCD